MDTSNLSLINSPARREQRPPKTEATEATPTQGFLLLLLMN